MNITKIQIHPHKNLYSQVKAFAEIILDNEFIIRDLVVYERDDGITIVNMPQKTRKDGSKQNVAHPITEPCRRYIENTVLDAYEDYINQPLKKS